ncbi:hypothetical protein BDQ17DRAFT_1327426 [Cyathus striatus]|nr:hypothetical protein BDQ17DRAFT_1327426 [Cyathus striatus]
MSTLASQKPLGGMHTKPPTSQSMSKGALTHPHNTSVILNWASPTEVDSSSISTCTRTTMVTKTIKPKLTLINTDQAHAILFEGDYLPTNCMFEASMAATILHQLMAVPSHVSSLVQCLEDKKAAGPAPQEQGTFMPTFSSQPSYAAVLTMAAAPHSGAICAAMPQDNWVPIKNFSPTSTDPNSIGNLSPCELVEKANLAIANIKENIALEDILS